MVDKSVLARRRYNNSYMQLINDHVVSSKIMSTTILFLRGRIVMCGSACTLFTIPGYGPYASSKAALAAYTDVIRYCY